MNKGGHNDPPTTPRPSIPPKGTNPPPDKRWLERLAYLYRELQDVPAPADTLCVPVGFMEEVLPTGILKSITEPAQGGTDYRQLFGVRILEMDWLPEWGLVWCKGTEMVHCIDLRRANT